MSIKYKMPLYILTVFLIFVVLLLGYFRLFLYDDLREEVDNYWLHYDQINKRIVGEIMSGYPDRKEMENNLQEIYETETIRVKILDTNGNKVMETGGQDDKVPVLKQKETAFYKNNLVYIMEIIHPSPLRNFRWGGSFGRFRMIGFTLLGLVIVSIIIYLHYFIVKPLLILQRILDKFSYNDLSINLPYTKRKDEIGYFCNKFYEMAERLKISRKEQVDIILSISHDLKTPLTSVIGFSERLMVGKRQTEERTREYSTIIYDKARDMNILLEEFHEFAINELQYTAFKKSVVEVRPFMEELSKKYEGELKEHHGEFALENQVPNSMIMMVDKDKLKRVFDNLISNSKKYGNENLKIKMICILEGKKLKVSIEDNGAGVPQEELDKIFDKFYRVDKSRSRDKGGSGLGLAICKRIIEAHGGAIWAYRSAGGGLGISFSIPVK
ncbi:MAG: HAMP domain-containing sensor histidine kinase [Desulfosporosinus sp.]